MIAIGPICFNPAHTKALQLYQGTPATLYFQHPPTFSLNTLALRSTMTVCEPRTRPNGRPSPQTFTARRRWSRSPPRAAPSPAPATPTHTPATCCCHGNWWRRPAAAYTWSLTPNSAWRSPRKECVGERERRAGGSACVHLGR